MQQHVFPADILPINSCIIQSMADVRDDPRIATALMSHQLYHGGISVELTNVEVTENADTASIVYSFKITNNDKNDLLIPDPDLMGTKLFHYYTNGVLLLSEDNHYYNSQYKRTSAPTPHTSWKSEWYSEVPSKCYIQRTIHLKGYPQLPAGHYRGEFLFSGPKKIEENERTRNDWRYWIGNVKSNEIQIVVSN